MVELRGPFHGNGFGKPLLQRTMEATTSTVTVLNKSITPMMSNRFFCKSVEEASCTNRCNRTKYSSRSLMEVRMSDSRSTVSWTVVIVEGMLCVGCWCSNKELEEKDGKYSEASSSVFAVSANKSWASEWSTLSMVEIPSKPS